MDVTKKNYKQALSEVKTLLKDAEFISFDLELTGLGRMLGDKNHDLDTPEERYQKAMKRVKEYGLIQIGMSIFRHCKSSKKFLSATYCFYLSGKSNGSYRYDSSSMIFLAENGFDFNKLFLEGLPFISLVEEEEYLKKMEKKIAHDKEITTPTPVKIKELKAKAFFCEAMQKVKKSKETGNDIVFDGKSLNGFLRKVLFTNVASQFPTSYFKTGSGNDRDIKVTHFNTEEEKNSFIQASFEEEFDEKLGFTHFVKAILESNVPLVGHNMILDLLHFTDKFVIPLPSTLKELKSIFKDNMPVMYDTKLFAKDPPFSGNIVNTSLGCLYKELLEKYSPPEFESEKGHTSYSISESGQSHDGGFDAFMTGICFITMVKTLVGKNWEKHSMMKLKKLEPYANRINFMGSYDIPFISMDKPDPIPDRSYIYYVTCPSNWTPLDVKSTFSILLTYRIVWKDDTHLFIIPQDNKDICSAKARLSMIRSACSPNVTVTMYDLNKKPVSNGNSDDTSSDSTVRTRSRTHAIKSPSIPLKRSSDAQDQDDAAAAQGGANPSAADGDESSRQLKRLKSVGSELLSNMTLESPVNPDKQLPTFPEVGDQSAVFDTSEVFPVPDQW